MFGKYKHSITNTLLENYHSKENFKKSFKSIMGQLKENKTAREFFVLYGEIENKKFDDKDLAEQYLNEVIKTLNGKKKNLRIPIIKEQDETTSICVTGGKTGGRGAGKWVGVNKMVDREKLGNVAVGTVATTDGIETKVTEIWKDSADRPSAFKFANNNTSATKVCFSVASTKKSGFVNKTVNYKAVTHSLEDVKSGKATLGIGDKGDVVKEMQKMVGAKPDGYFGPNTLAKVKEYQKTNNFTVTGKMDKESLGGGVSKTTVTVKNSPGCKGNCKNGQGTYTWKSGSEYVGEWKDDTQNGQGTYTSANGDKYVGEWRMGKKDGEGTDTWKSGSEYVGEYKDSKIHGQGTYTWASGSEYAGQWKDGKRHGQGIFRNEKDPSKNKDGEWVDGEFNASALQVENYNKIYSQLDSLIFNDSVGAIENNLINKRDLVEHLISEDKYKKIDNPAPMSLLNNLIARKFNEKYYSLSEEDKTKLKNLSSMDKNELENKVIELKESTLSKLKTLKEESEDKEMKNKIQEVCESINKSSNNTSSIIKMEKLNKSLIK